MTVNAGIYLTRDVPETGSQRTSHELVWQMPNYRASNLTTRRR